MAMMLRGLCHRDPPEQLVKLVFDETAGNPFFVEELYSHLVEEKKIFDASGRFRDDVKISDSDVPDRTAGRWPKARAPGADREAGFDSRRSHRPQLQL
jgi:hypothetical protein